MEFVQILHGSLCQTAEMQVLITELLPVESITTSRQNMARHLGKQSRCRSSGSPLASSHSGGSWHVSTAAVIASHRDSLVGFLPQHRKIHTEVPFWWLRLPPFQMAVMNECVEIEFSHEKPFPTVSCHSLDHLQWIGRQMPKWSVSHCVKEKTITAGRSH